jgi:hypothetical protein
MLRSCATLDYRCSAARPEFWNPTAEVQFLRGRRERFHPTDLHEGLLHNREVETARPRRVVEDLLAGDPQLGASTGSP